MKVTVINEYDTETAIDYARTYNGGEYAADTIRALVAKIEQMAEAMLTPQPHRQRIGLNAEVRVRLTHFGTALVRESGRSVPNMDLNGETKFQLWDLMAVFGPRLYHGMPNIPFLNNEIILTTEPTP